MTAQPLLPPIFASTDILETLFGPDLPDTRETPANGQALADIVSGKWASPIEPPELELGDDSEGFVLGGDAGTAIGDLSIGSPDADSNAPIYQPTAMTSGPTLVTPGFDPVNAGPGSGGGGGGKQQSPELAATYISGLADTEETDFFNVKIEFYGGWSFDLMQAFGTAADFLSEVILDGLQDDPNAWNTFGNSRKDTFTVDDVLIEAYLPPIDGEGNILGRAGPYSVRDPGSPDQYTTVVALMEFDSADASSLNASNDWDATVLHEMLHSIGLGSLWSYWDVVETVQIAGQDTRRPSDDVFDSTYVGSNGTAVYDLDRAADDPAALMVETDGGSGTAGAHWDEDAYGAELMTGYLGGEDPYLADWSIASLGDIGYTVADYTDPGVAPNRLSGGINLEDVAVVNDFDIVDSTLISDFVLV